jgi:hypothetical protein
MSQGGVKAKWNHEFIKQITKEVQIQVGITEESNKTYDTGESYAEVMKKNYYGSGVPATDPYIEPLIKHADEVNAEFALQFKRVYKTQSIPDSLGQAMGVAHRNNVVRAFESQGDGTWKKLSRITLALRKKGRGDKRLIDSKKNMKAQSFKYKVI